jgi:hypothetical protein
MRNTAKVSGGAPDGWQELDASSRGSSEMAGYWKGLCPALDCDGLMMMMMMTGGKW